ncbi:MAG: hypothetical protein NTZ71_17465 [Planctomycetota bacterium]|nr:hypothetical protein [Planctomycetota bacterium]
MSQNKVRSMPWKTACDLIENQESLARRFQEAFRLGNTSEAKSLANELSLRLHNAVDECNLTAAASVAYHHLSRKGSWIDVVGLANDAANEAFSEFSKNPLNWKSHEKFSSYMKRALDWRSRDEVRLHYRHHEGRIEGTWGDDASASFPGLETPLAANAGTEQAYNFLEADLKAFVATLPEAQKVIATELYLSPDGRSQVELAQFFGRSEAWVSGIAKATRQLIASHIDGGESLDQAA